MKRTSVVVALAASVLLLALGVVFLIAATSRPSRILVALVFLVFGGALLLWAILTLRRQAELSPESLATGTVDLARRLGGDVTVAQVQAEFRIPNKLALSVLETLCSRGECEREQRTDHYVYVFKSVMPAKAIKACPYCGSRFAVRSAARECPNCGAALEITKE
jgi:hypothetical protein